MAFYDQRKLVDAFLHRKLYVEIFRALRGGHCDKCDLDHEPEKARCDNCGDEIFPSKVYLFSISGQDTGIECENVAEAKELAKAWIDDMVDGPDDADDELPEPPPPKKRGRAGKRSPFGGAANDLVEQCKKLGWGQRARAILGADAKKT